MVSKIRTDRRVVRSKDALKTTLLELMAEKPFQTISITEIVKHANYNRSTFYSHYDNQEALLNDIMDDVLEELIKAFRAPYEKIELIGIERMNANAVKLFDHIYENAARYSVLMKAPVQPDFRRKIFLTLKKTIMNDLQDAFVATEDGLNRELLTIYSLQALLGLVFHWIEEGFIKSPDYMVEQLLLILNYNTPVTLKYI